MKYTFKTVCISAIIMATIGAFGIYSEKHATTVGTVALYNIEALTADEVGMTYTCYKTITEKDGCQVRYCQTCKFTPGTDSWIGSKSQCTYQ